MKIKQFFLKWSTCLYVLKDVSEALLQCVMRSALFIHGHIALRLSYSLVRSGILSLHQWFILESVPQRVIKNNNKLIKSYNLPPVKSLYTYLVLPIKKWHKVNKRVLYKIVKKKLQRKIEVNKSVFFNTIVEVIWLSLSIYWMGHPWILLHLTPRFEADRDTEICWFL